MNSPVTGKPMELRKEWVELDFRKERFPALSFYFYCEDSGEQFETEEQLALTMTQVHNQYREKHNLPFPEDIRAIREQYGLSARKMSEVLGFGINQYRQYEAGDIPNQSNARLIQLIEDPEEFAKLLRLNGSLSDKEKARILKGLAKLPLKKEKREKWKAQYLLKDLKPTAITGYRKPSLEKVLHLVAFFAREMAPYKVKMNKLLFYADFMHYRLRGYSISGIRYRAIQMGPVPDNFDGLFNEARENELIHIAYTTFPNGMGEQYLPGSRKPDPDLFGETELEVMRQVAAHFEHTSTPDFIAISHREAGWKENFESRGLIDYRYAFELQEVFQKN